MSMVGFDSPRLRALRMRGMSCPAVPEDEQLQELCPIALVHKAPAPVHLHGPARCKLCTDLRLACLTGAGRGRQFT